MKKPIFLLLLICFSVSYTAYPQDENPKSFDFNKPFHALGFSVFNGINFAPKPDYYGTIKPILYNAYVPEFVLQYNCMIKNGFGIALEVPFGMFMRKSLMKLSDYGAPEDVPLEMGDDYIGFTAKLTLLKELNRKVCMQGELGVKFHPFYHSADKWYQRDYEEILYFGDDFYYNDGYPPITFITIEQKYYAIPDATAGLQFFFHSPKKPKSNFVLGLTANLSFVERIKVFYDTQFSEVSFENQSIGDYGWNSTSVGISVGYRFFGVK